MVPTTGPKNMEMPGPAVSVNEEYGSSGIAHRRAGLA
jgi:hypothetical protein